jgi:2-polyprenyl-6-methoxyphenol hydroxylase-like FAD-dependent oxidoreductase
VPPPDTDALIVGAGPTGLMLANQLGRRGVRVLIIDRHSGPAQQSRALAVHARSLEIFAKLGIAQQALELGKRAAGANMWALGRRMARVPLGDIGQGVSPFPFVLMLGQDDSERLLGDRLREQGIPVQWNTELIALEQQADRVNVTLRQPDGTARKLAAAWVAGCDGARSAVRELNGIGFPGAPYEHVFFVADTEATGRMVPDELNVYLLSDGFHLFFPMRGANRWRIVGILPPALRGRDDIAFDEVVPSLRGEAGSGLSFTKCFWFSTYRIHHRCAERFSAGRCFLLGDAAHIHSPVGGQGMNTGLQDAYNLAWKLALVVAGRARPGLLDSYAAERMPVAHRLVNTTDRLFTLIVSDSRTAGLFRTRIMARVLAFAMTLERVRGLAFRTLSQTGIHYRRGPLSARLPGLPEAAPQPGDRFPWLKLRFRPDGPIEDLYQRLDDTRFNLVAIGQDLPGEGAAASGDGLRTHAVPGDPHNAGELARAGIPGSAFYLLRPDGHVGLAGGRLESGAVSRYLSERHIAG